MKFENPVLKDFNYFCLAGNEIVLQGGENKRFFF